MLYSKPLLEAVIVCVEYGTCIQSVAQTTAADIKVHVAIVWTTGCSQYCIGVLGCQIQSDKTRGL